MGGAITRGGGGPWPPGPPPGAAYANYCQHEKSAKRCTFKTFKLVGDNIDKNINPQDVRIDSQTVSLHYFHSYAVRDRIDLSNYEDDPCFVDSASVLPHLSTVLPSSEDLEAISENFIHLVARILIVYIPYFSTIGAGFKKQHITHEFYSEMAEKSEVVCTCV